MICVQLRTKTRTSISRKICCVRLGFQILYAVEQFSSLFSKDKYTKPMIRLPRACLGRSAVQIPANSSHMCCVELALKGLASAAKGLLYPNPNPGGVWKTKKNTGFPRSLTDGYVMLMRNSYPWLPLPAWYGCARAWGNWPPENTITYHNTLSLSSQNFA